MQTNVLYYGDNLDILQKHIPDNSIDLIYLDPPFNSKATYNILFKEPTGEPSQAQISAFEDTWHWGDEAEQTFQQIVDTAPAKVIEMVRAFRSFIGTNDMMAYLVMMCIRLIELKRVLKDTGSIYLHCDPTASHYLKIVMDTIFSPTNFRNEIVWKRTTAHNDPKRFGRIHDILLFYAKSSPPTWNPVFASYDSEYIETYYRYTDENGKKFLSRDLTAPSHGFVSGQYEWRGKYPPKGRMWAYTKGNMEQLEAGGRIFYTKNGYPRLKQYLEDMPGMPAQSIWSDVLNIRSWHKEDLGYDTQKPLALLERIIQASSNQGDIVLDPFCGCGTALVAAQKLSRKWIGIDITHLAISVMKWRLQQMFPSIQYKVIGEPVDLAGARELANQNKYQFQWWALSLIGARPYGDKKKGADTGIDGYLYFMDEKDKVKRAIVQVKSGGVSVNLIRDLRGVIDREKAEMGIFITLEPATKPMETEAVSQGFYRSPLGKDYPKMQILTIEELLRDKKPDMPPWVSPVQAPPVSKKREGKEIKML